MFLQKMGLSKYSKPSGVQKVKPVQAAAPVVEVQVAADPLPPVSEESADASMREDELCQAFSESMLAKQDVDEQDADMPQFCSQYVKDIYKYLSVLEVWSSHSLAELPTVTGLTSVCLLRCSRL